MLNAANLPPHDKLPILSTPAEVRKLILKLRWMGLEKEAVMLHTRLAAIAPGACACLWPMDTD